ncbi:MAG: hypothetical protein ACRDZ4_18595 [Egibacteraceae bacterium]
MTAPRANSGGSAVRVERDDPLVVSCADCGGVRQLWGYEPIELLPWKVVEHWLVAHWDRTGLDEQGDRA